MCAAGSIEASRLGIPHRSMDACNDGYIRKLAWARRQRRISARPCLAGVVRGDSRLLLWCSERDGFRRSRPGLPHRYIRGAANRSITCVLTDAENVVMGGQICHGLVDLRAVYSRMALRRCPCPWQNCTGPAG